MLGGSMKNVQKQNKNQDRGMVAPAGPVRRKNTDVISRLQ